MNEIYQVICSFFLFSRIVYITKHIAAERKASPTALFTFIYYDNNKKRSLVCGEREREIVSNHYRIVFVCVYLYPVYPHRNYHASRN